MSAQKDSRPEFGSAVAELTHQAALEQIMGHTASSPAVVSRAVLIRQSTRCCHVADPSHMELKSFAPVGSREGNARVCPGAQLCLVNTMLGTPPKVNSSPQHSYRSVDLAESEVVEFQRCEPYKTELMHG